MHSIFQLLIYFLLIAGILLSSMVLDQRQRSAKPRHESQSSKATWHHLAQ